MSDKPTIPEVRARFQRYHQKNAAWGSLHIVLEDGNVHDDHVRHCLKWAIREGDNEGMALAEILLQMSQSQRKRLGMLAWPVPDEDLK